MIRPASSTAGSAKTLQEVKTRVICRITGQTGVAQHAIV